MLSLLVVKNTQNRTLMRLRPPWIVPASQRYLVGCLCEQCHNVTLHLRYKHHLMNVYVSISLLKKVGSQNLSLYDWNLIYAAVSGPSRVVP